MSADAFLDWSRTHHGPRCELVAGEIVAMAPERVAHVRLKARVWRALDDALRAAGSRCEALTDGATVRIDDETVYEPDALVHYSERLSADAIVVPDPLIVVEVLSPSTAGRDAAAKLEDYFRLSSVVHYLIFKTERPALIHHKRTAGAIETSILRQGMVELDPPGIALSLDGIFGNGD